MVPGLDLCYTDPAQHLRTASYFLNDLDDKSDISYLSNVSVDDLSDQSDVWFMFVKFVFYCAICTAMESFVTTAAKVGLPPFS